MEFVDGSFIFLHVLIVNIRTSLLRLLEYFNEY